MSLPRQTVIASLDKSEYELFLAPNLKGQDWPFDIERVEPSLGVGPLIDRINQSNSQVLMSAWETPQLPEDLPVKVPSLRYLCHICGAVRLFIPRVLFQKGLIVTNWGDTIAHTIAEHCLLQVLAALRHATFWQFHMHLRGGHRSDDHNLRSLFDKRVGIHGLGVIARKFVELVRPFRCAVSAYSPHVPDDIFRQCGVRRCNSLEELFAQNDVIVELAALTDANRGIVTEKLLRMIPAGGAFVNSGRGRVVDEKGLIKVASEGRIQFALDVFEQEPLPASSPLCGMENVFLTPHVAGLIEDQFYLCGLQALHNASAYFSGGQPQSIVSPEQYDRMT
jgi:phosphoglycerate dehydrogenase-like enzyme